jgi:hypothetical protein
MDEHTRVSDPNDWPPSRLDEIYLPSICEAAALRTPWLLAASYEPRRQLNDRRLAVGYKVGSVLVIPELFEFLVAIVGVSQRHVVEH